jgi:hypothetical protein
MASAKKSQYLDSLSVKDIYVRGVNNATLPQDQILVTDGQGGTVWQDTGALVAGGAFTTINTTPSTIVARVSNPFISLLNGPNAGLTMDSTAPNTLRFFANAFNQINIESIATGQSTLLSAYDNPTNTYKSTFTLVAGDNIILSTNSTTNTVVFNVPPATNATLATLSTFLWNMSTLNSSIAGDIAGFNSPFTGQPFIQHGSATMNGSGQVTITLGKVYTALNYSVQLSYTGSLLPTQILRSQITNLSNFVCYGDANRSFTWTTYGPIF